MPCAQEVAVYAHASQALLVGNSYVTNQQRTFKTAGVYMVCEGEMYSTIVLNL